MQRLTILAAALLACGCSGKPGRLSPPDVSADDAADAALAANDKNQDGNLGKDELSSSPGLALALPRWWKRQKMGADDAAVASRNDRAANRRGRISRR